MRVVEVVQAHTASSEVKSSLEVAGDSPTLTPTKQPVLLCLPWQNPFDSLLESTLDC